MFLKFLLVTVNLFLVHGFEFSDNEVAFVLCGELNNYTVPTIKTLNGFGLSAIVSVEDTNTIPPPLLKYFDNSDNYILKNSSVFSQIEAYYLPIEDDIEFKVWNDMKNNIVKGIVMIPFSHHTHNYLNEFIHDLVRFKINIKHIKNIDIV